jgi:membrane associated rhomboid family serine protease
MSGNHERIRFRIFSTLLNILSQILRYTGRFRSRVIGTFSLTLLLVTVFQVEVLGAHFFGYSSAQALLGSFSRQVKIVIVATIGPFIHQGPQHLTDNLGVLIVAGFYLEYQYNRRYLYLFYIATGYTAAWIPIALGSVGSVGASGVTFGLTTWLLIHSISRIFEMAYKESLDLRALHFGAVIFGLVKFQQAVSIIGSMDGADDITHFFGALIGLIIGLQFVLDYHELGFSDRLSNFE